MATKTTESLDQINARITAQNNALLKSQGYNPLTTQQQQNGVSATKIGTPLPTATTAVKTTTPKTTTTKTTTTKTTTPVTKPTNTTPYPIATNPTIRDVADINGYTVTYDNNTKRVTVTNPVTKKSVNFVSGQGLEYGMGGLVGDANIVTDLTKLKTALSASPVTPTKPITPTPVTPTKPTTTQPVYTTQPVGTPQPIVPTKPTQPVSPTLRDIAGQQGYSVTYDDKTKLVTITNPTNNRSISFTSGQGSEYGLGGLINDQNIVSDANKLNSILTSPSVRDVAGQQGYTVGYNDQTKLVNITNPTNNQSIEFPSGQGDQYGLGGLVNDQNIVTDATKLNQALAGQTGQPTTQPTTQPQNDVIANYQTQLDLANKQIAENNKKLQELYDAINFDKYKSPYEQQINNTLNSAYNTPFSYDPNKDSALKLAQQQAQKSVMDEMNRRGILSSTITTDRAQKVSQELVPQYETLAFNRYNQNIQNQLQKANVLQSLDKMAYTQYSDYINNQFKNLDAVANLNKNQISTIQFNLDNLYTISKMKSDEEIKQLQKQQAEIQKALDRVELRDFVDNKDAVILGVPVNTPSKNARVRAFELDKIITNALARAEEQKMIDDNKYANDKATVDEAQATKTAQDTALANIVSLIANASPTEALSSVTNPAVREDLIKKMGAENYNNLISDLQKRKATDAKTAFDQSMKLRAQQATEANQQATRAEATRHNTEMEKKTTTNSATSKIESDMEKKIDELYTSKQYEPIYKDEIVYNTTTEKNEKKRVQVGERDTGRRVMSVQDKIDIATYLRNAEDAGTPKEIINRLLTKYNIPIK